MNIWLINPFSDLPNEGASEGRFCCLARMLVEQGHSVTWWTVDFHHRTKRRRSVPSVPSHEETTRPGALRTGTSASEGGSGGSLDMQLLAVPAYTRNISLARLRSHRVYGGEFAKAAAARIANDSATVPDVIHLSAPPLDCVEPALALKERFGCRVTIDVMDLWPETFTRLIPGGSFLRRVVGGVLFAPMFRKARKGYRMADGVSAVSQEYLNLIHEIAPKQSLHLCYVGGELIKAKDSLSDSATDPVRFIYVGAITPTYDLDTILDAAIALKSEGLHFEVLFAGSGVAEAGLKQRASDLGLTDVVRFLGFLHQGQLQAALEEADVGLNAIMPGTYITMPHKLSDYLCAGLAVINSTEGEPEELLADAGAGSYYRAGDTLMLVQVMRAYLQSPERVEKEKRQAAVLAAKHFDRKKTYPTFAYWVVGD